MNDELLFRIIFFALWIVYIAYLTGKEYYAREEPATRFSIRKHLREASKREGKVRIVARALLTPFWISGFILYAVYPDWMTLFTIPLPVWLRWIAVGLSLATIPLIVWAYRTLGKQWTAPKLLLRKEHTLVTNGPYRYVRHPMYASGFTFMIALAVATANWLVVLPMIAGTALLYAQVGREEAMLIERFGDDYRAYMKRTGRFLPRFQNLDRYPRID